MLPLRIRMLTSSVVCSTVRQHRCLHLYLHRTAKSKHCTELLQKSLNVRWTWNNILYRQFSKKTELIHNQVKRNELRRLFQQANPEKWKLAGALCLLFISSGVTMAVPFCIGKVIDVIYASEPEEKKKHLQYICTVFIILFIIGGLANFGRVYLMQTSGQRVVRNLRQQVFSSILNQEVTFFDKNKTGELINRLSSDAALVGYCITQNISDGLRSLTAIVACTSMMVYMSPHLAMVGLSIVPPVAALGIMYGRFVRNITKSVQDKLADSTQIAEERIGNIRTVKAFVQEDREKHLYANKLKELLKLQYVEALAKAAFFGMAGFSGNLVVLTVLYYGGNLMADSQITVGNLSAFLLYAAYMGISLGGLSSFYSELMKGVGASIKLWDIIDKVPAITSIGFIPNLPPIGKIEFNNVDFNYPTRSEAAVLKNLNLRIEAGTMTAIVGKSGSGKSTIVALLLRLYDPVSGALFLDGEDFRSFDLDWLRSHIGIVNQEPILFSCSVRENITYGAADKKPVSEEDIRKAAEDANALNFIESFPEGFDTIVGERGTNLSGGQKQRIAIARAILKNPRILVLDEATSALDSESEFLVQEALDRLMDGRTVVIIAHRLSTIKHANCIAVFSDGRITEMGNYKQLMGIEGGKFRTLMERQTVSHQHVKY